MLAGCKKLLKRPLEKRKVTSHLLKPDGGLFLTGNAGAFEDAAKSQSVVNIGTAGHVDHGNAHPC